MIDPIEWQGTWFIRMPNGNEIPFRGSLLYTPSNGCILKASTDETEDAERFLDFIYDSNRIEIIYGHEHIHHKGLILKKCVVTDAQQGDGIFINVVVSEVIENFHYEDPHPLRFGKACVEFSALTSWFDHNNKEVKFHHEHDPTITYTFIYRKPEELLFCINEQFDIKFSSGYAMTRSDEKRSGNFFTEKTDFCIVSKKGNVSINELDKYSEHFRRLLAILYHQYCFAIGHRYFYDNESGQFNKYYKQKGFDLPNNYSTPGRILVKYNGIRDIVGSVFKRWFKYRESSDMTYVTYIASKSLGSFSEEVFLENARALEVYDKAISKKDRTFKERVANLIEDVKEICDETVFKQFIPDTDRFIHLVVKNRNYLTHYGDGSIVEEDELEIEDLLRITRKCKIILITSLLKNLGIDSGKYFNRLVERYHKLL